MRQPLRPGHTVSRNREGVVSHRTEARGNSSLNHSSTVNTFSPSWLAGVFPRAGVSVFRQRRAYRVCSRAGQAFIVPRVALETLIGNHGDVAALGRR